MRPKLLRAVVALLVIALVPGIPPARAQQGGAELSVIGQPIWHDTDDSIDLRLRIANASSEPLEGYSLSLIAHGRTTSRSALNDSFSSPPAFTTSAYQPELPEEPIPPGESISVVIDDPLTRLSSLATAVDGGVYPVTVALFDGSGAELDAVTTPFIVYPTTPDAALNLVLVAPLNAVPSRGPGRIFSPPPGGSPSLEDAVLEGGWIDGVVSALEGASVPEVRRVVVRRPPGDRRAERRSRRAERSVRIPALQLGIAPTPRLIDELSDLANGFLTENSGDENRVPPTSEKSSAAASLVQRLTALLRRPSVQPLLTPYAYPDLPALQRELTAARMAAQINEGDLVLRNVLELDSRSDWLLAPAGRLDQTTLDDLRTIGGLGEHTFLSPDSLEDDAGPARSGCPEPALSFVCPVEVRTVQGPTTGFVADDTLQERLGDLVAEPHGRLEVQRFFAELAQIREELPGRGDRIVQVTVPPSWHPPPRFARLLFEGLQDAPWIHTLTPSRALTSTQVHAPVPKRLIADLDPLRSQPDESWFDSLQTALDSVDSFSAVRPPQEHTQRLNRNVMVGESRLWWPDIALLGQGEAFTRSTSTEVASVFDSIEIVGIDEIRLTSSRGELPIEIRNRNDFPVTVDVRFSSTGLELDRSAVADQRIQPDTSLLLDEDLTVESSGIYTVSVSVTTPNGFLIADKRIEIRSTEFNEVALGITLGALAFLILFYVTRVVRRHRHGENQSSGAPA